MLFMNKVIVSQTFQNDWVCPFNGKVKNLPIWLGETPRHAHGSLAMVIQVSVGASMALPTYVELGVVLTAWVRQDVRSYI